MNTSEFEFEEWIKTTEHYQEWLKAKEHFQEWLRTKENVSTTTAFDYEPTHGSGTSQPIGLPSRSSDQPMEHASSPAKEQRSASSSSGQADSLEASQSEGVRNLASQGLDAGSVPMKMSKEEEAAWVERIIKVFNTLDREGLARTVHNDAVSAIY